MRNKPLPGMMKHSPIKQYGHQKKNRTRAQGGNRPNPGGTSISVGEVFEKYGKKVKDKIDKLITKDKKINLKQKSIMEEGKKKTKSWDIL